MGCRSFFLLVVAMPTPLSYQKRTYRQRQMAVGLVTSLVQIEESDLCILADRAVTELATDRLLFYRQQLENHIRRCPEFATALQPLAEDPHCRPIIQDMLQAAASAGVGPMAAVAGVLAEYIGGDILAAGVQEVMVENGGDIFLFRHSACVVEIYAGTSPLSGCVGVRLPAGKAVGICTSSGRIGHSLSFGAADSATVIAASTALADAAATRLGNEIGKGRGKDRGIEAALATIRAIPGVHGAVAICDKLLGAAGEVELVRLG